MIFLKFKDIRVLRIKTLSACPQFLPSAGGRESEKFGRATVEKRKQSAARAKHSV